MNPKSLDELREQFEKREKTPEKKKEEFQTPSDMVWQSNVYMCPRIIATYWRPAFSGTEAKVFDYITYKIFGFSKDQSQSQQENQDGDLIAFKQMMEGTTTKNEQGIKIRWDWGAGVNKQALINSLTLFEFLRLIEVERKQDDRGKKETNKYRLRIMRDYEAMSVDQRKIYMMQNPKQLVDEAREFLKHSGRWII